MARRPANAATRFGANKSKVLPERDRWVHSAAGQLPGRRRPCGIRERECSGWTGGCSGWMQARKNWASTAARAAYRPIRSQAADLASRLDTRGRLGPRLLVAKCAADHSTQVRADSDSDQSSQDIGARSRNSLAKVGTGR